jgi:hypothetical protein
MTTKTVALNVVTLAIIAALCLLLIEGVPMSMPGAYGHQVLATFVFFGLLIAGGVWSLLTWFGVESWVATADEDNRLAALLHKFQMKVKMNFAFGITFTFLSVVAHTAAIYSMVIALHQLIF